MDNIQDIVDLVQVAEVAEFVEDVVEAENAPARLPRRYLRDGQNPLEFYSEEEFRRRYRLRKNTVTDVLLPIVIAHIEPPADRRGLPIAPLFQILTCLRFYATGNFQLVDADLLQLSQPTVCRIVKQLSRVFAENLAQYVHFPRTEEERRRNTILFYQRAQFPGVSGCIDGTHIRIVNPGNDNAEVFRNRKGYFSLNVQVVAGPQLEIMDIVVRYPGSTHDNVIFDRSAVRLRFDRGDIRGKLLGDNGYACRPYLLTPVIQPATPAEQRYNFAHVRTRNVVERLFGVWKRRFPCLQNGFRVQPQTIIAAICATAILHNIAIANNDILEAGEEDVEVVVPHEIPANNVMGLAYRTQFIQQHFN